MRDALGASEVLVQQTEGEQRRPKTRWPGVRGDVLAAQSPWRVFTRPPGTTLQRNKRSERAGAGPRASQMLTFDCPSTPSAGR